MRLNVNITDETRATLDRVAEKQGDLTSAVRWVADLAKYLLDAVDDGGRVVIERDGRVIEVAFL